MHKKSHSPKPARRSSRKLLKKPELVKSKKDGGSRIKATSRSNSITEITGHESKKEKSHSKSREARKTSRRNTKTNISHKVPTKSKSPKENGRRISHPTSSKKSLTEPKFIRMKKMQASTKKTSDLSKTKAVVKVEKIGQGSGTLGDRTKAKPSSNSRKAEEGKEKSTPSHKDFLITQITKECYICNSKALYYVKGFFCLECIKKFQNVVDSANTIRCSNGGKCAAKKNCSFCLSEVFYTYGVKASDACGIEGIVRSYSAIEEISKRSSKLTEDEKAFCRYFDNSLNYALDWLWKQGDLLKLSPMDRLTLLEMNCGRARLLWITIESIPRHGVIKITDAYLGLRNFSCETIVKTVIDISDMAMYFSSLSFTPQHLYFVKLLSFFHLGKCVTCSMENTVQSSCDCTKTTFVRAKEIKMISENYWKILKEMNVPEGDIEIIGSFIQLMQCMNEVLTKEELVEDAQFSFKRWIILHPEWDKAMKDVIPQSFEHHSIQRYNFSQYLNRTAIEVLKHAYDSLELHFSSRDQKTLLYRHIMQLIVLSICWNLEPIFGNNDEQLSDNIIKLLWTELKAIQCSLQKQVSEFISLPDFEIMMLTRESVKNSNSLMDANLKEIDDISRNLVFENMENKLMGKIAAKHQRISQIKTVQTSVLAIMQKIDKISATIESMENFLPLVFNVKYWAIETQ